MSLPETFYIALCVTILLLGVVYWFWTQVQYLQRKVNLLDNVVYEMKTLVSNLPGPGASPPISQSDMPAFKAENEFMINSDDNDGPAGGEVQDSYAPPPESIAGDLEQERLASETEFEPFSGRSSEPVMNEKPIYQPPAEVNIVSEVVTDELQPGGLAEPAVNTKKSAAAIESPLNGLSLKELKKMAEANNIPGASEMKKRDLIRALRDTVSTLINNDAPQVLSFDEIASPTVD
jgi:hypothetical protein